MIPVKSLVTALQKVYEYRLNGSMKLFPIIITIDINNLVFGKYVTLLKQDIADELISDPKKPLLMFLDLLIDFYTTVKDFYIVPILFLYQTKGDPIIQRRLYSNYKINRMHRKQVIPKEQAETIQKIWSIIDKTISKLPQFVNGIYHIEALHFDDDVIPYYIKKNIYNNAVVYFMKKIAELNIKPCFVIISNDSDMYQLVDETTFVFDWKSQELIDMISVYKKFKVYPNEIALYKALAGDMSDSIKGLKGIGPRNARKIIESLRIIYKPEKNIMLAPEHLDERLIYNPRLANIIETNFNELKTIYTLTALHEQLDKLSEINLYLSDKFKNFVIKEANAHEILTFLISQKQQLQTIEI